MLGKMQTLLDLVSNSLVVSAAPQRLSVISHQVSQSFSFFRRYSTAIQSYPTLTSLPCFLRCFLLVFAGLSWRAVTHGVYKSGQARQGKADVQRRFESLELDV